jgi:capsid protein
MVLDGGAYDGEKNPGDLAGWFRLLTGNSPNDFLYGTYGLVSQSCLTLYHTFGPAAAAVNKHTDYCIGDGLYFRSQPDYDLLGWKKEYARDWARRFQKLLAYKMAALNLYQKQNAAFRWALAGGDTVTYFIREKGEPLDIVEFPGTEIDGEKNGGNVTLGIQHDRFYRREGFYNPGGEYTAFAADGRQQAVQFYLKRAPRQVRGWPLIYSQIATAKNDDRFEDATIAAAILEAIITIVTETEDPLETKNQIEQLAARARRRGPAGKVLDAFSGIGNAARMGAGNVLNITTGGKVTPLEKKTPSGTYPAFKEWRIKQFAMGANTPPEVLLSEYSTSYTAHMGSRNDFLKTVLWEREEFARVWMKAVIKELALELILEGAVDAPAFITGGPMIQEAYLKGIHLGPVPGFINPLQEITAKEKSVANMFSLRGDEMFNLSGADYEDVLAEWQLQEKLFRQTGDAEKARALAEQDEKNLDNEREDEGEEGEEEEA